MPIRRMYFSPSTVTGVSIVSSAIAVYQCLKWGEINCIRCLLEYVCWKETTNPMVVWFCVRALSEVELLQTVINSTDSYTLQYSTVWFNRYFNVGPGLLREARPLEVVNKVFGRAVETDKVFRKEKVTPYLWYPNLGRQGLLQEAFKCTFFFPLTIKETSMTFWDRILGFHMILFGKMDPTPRWAPIEVSYIQSMIQTTVQVGFWFSPSDLASLVTVYSIFLHCL